MENDDYSENPKCIVLSLLFSNLTEKFERQFTIGIDQPLFLLKYLFFEFLRIFVLRMAS